MAKISERWTWAEVLAWIWFRDLQKVAEMGNYGDSGSLIQWKRACIMYPNDEGILPQFSNESVRLAVLLKEGKVSATGVFNAENRRRVIPVDDWKLYAEKFPEIFKRGTNKRWREITFERRKIAQLFPRTSPTAVAALKFRRNLEAMISSGAQPSSKKAIVDTALETIPGLSERGALEVWKELVTSEKPDGWGVSGRRKKGST